MSPHDTDGHRTSTPAIRAAPTPFSNGWNTPALWAFAVSGVFSVATVWVPALADPSGFSWIIGVVLGAGPHLVVMRGRQIITSDADR